MKKTTLFPETKIPEVLFRAPAARRVFDRYGLRGCGGPLGPNESLEFFSRAHGVDLPTLLRELGDAIDENPAPIEPVPERSIDSVYRPFFLAGILSVLTAGATWGAMILIQIAKTGSFVAPSIFDVNAHGHAQILGWVGLFVMGFAYQAFPRFKHTEIAHPNLAFLSLALLVSGMILHVGAEPFARANANLLATSVIGSILEVIAVGIFVFEIGLVLRGGTRAPRTYERYIEAGLFWFFVGTVYEGFHSYGLLTAVDDKELLSRVATFQFPLRDIEIHGLAMSMILGVSQWYLPAIYRFIEPTRERSRYCFWPIQIGIVASISGFLAMRLTGSHAWAALYYLGSVSMVAGTVSLSWPWFRGTFGVVDRSTKFFRSAYGWLYLSFVLLLTAPLYAVLTHQAFSHAFYGATRHAITVGFISLMIMGVAAKVVPTLNGLATEGLTTLAIPFALVNAGCALRVFGQIATDFVPGAYGVIGISGLLEVTGLALWGISLAGILLRGAPWGDVVTNDGVGGDADDGPCVPAPGTNVARLLARHPFLIETFYDAGFKPLVNPVLRRTLAHTVTIETACRLTGVDLDAFLGAVSERIEREAERATSARGSRTPCAGGASFSV